jgi:hypothetical protein
MEHLAERTAARAARRERLLGQPLEHLDVLTAPRARVLVGGHEASMVAASGRRPFPAARAGESLGRPMTWRGEAMGRATAGALGRARGMLPNPCPGVLA